MAEKKVEKTSYIQKYKASRKEQKIRSYKLGFWKFLLRETLLPAFGGLIGIIIFHYLKNEPLRFEFISIFIMVFLPVQSIIVSIRWCLIRNKVENK